MSKRIFVDIKEIASHNSLYRAWQLCSNGNGKDERKDVIKYAENLEENLKSLQKRLLDDTWIPDKGRDFWLYTENKWRLIHVVGIEDRIVHQSVVYHFALERKFIRRTFGSIKGRGTLKANKQIRNDLFKSEFDYVIKMDAHKYYPNINKIKLIELIRAKYKGERALKLFSDIINSYNPGNEKGVSIGALTSQNNGNYYLTSFDHFVSEVLGIKYYTRYVDDIVIFCKSKRDAAKWIPQMIRKAAEFDIQFGKIELYPIKSRKVDFCGYQVDKNCVLLRKSILKKFIKKLNKFEKYPSKDGLYERNCICSYLGMLKYCDSKHIINNLKNEYYEVFERIDRYASRKRGQKNEVASA